MREERRSLQYVAFKTIDPTCLCPNTSLWPSTLGQEERGKIFYQSSTFSHCFSTLVFVIQPQQVVLLKWAALYHPSKYCLGDGTFSTYFLTYFLITICGVSSVALNNAVFCWSPSVTMSSCRRLSISQLPWVLRSETGLLVLHLELFP